MMTMIIDPNEAFAGIKPKKLVDVMGIIPFFVQDVALSQPESASEAFELLQECYGYPVGDLLENGVGKVEQDGTYIYPDDPDLSPIALFELPDDIQVFVYQYAFVAVRDAKTTLMARME